MRALHAPISKEEEVLKQIPVGTRCKRVLHLYSCFLLRVLLVYAVV
jgi:hypothetical protein